LTGLSRQDPVHSRRFLLIFILLLLTLNLSLFLPSMKGGFLWDDKYFVSENPDLLSQGFLRRFLSSPFGGAEGFDENSPKAGSNRQFYRPLTSLSYWLDLQVWGLNPAGFHLTNILLHILNSLLLLGLLLKLGSSLSAAFSGALLFSAFPAHFENVSWISGRTDLLSFLLAALSLLYFLDFLRKKGLARLVVSSVFYLAALLAKESAVLLPLLLVLLLYGKRRGVKDRLYPLVPFGLAFLAWASLRFNAFGSAQLHSSGRTLPDFLGTVGFYTFKMIFPFRLSVTISPQPVFGSPAGQALGLLVVILTAASLFFFLKGRTGSLIFFGVPAYFFLLVPSVAVIFSSATLSLLAWRFLYLPSAVFLSGLAWGLFSLTRRRAVPAVILIVLLGAYAVELVPKTRLYGRDESGFWLGITDLDREDLSARFNIGIKSLPVDEGRALSVFESILREKNHPLSEFWTRRVNEELAIYFAFQKDFGRADRYFEELRKSPSGLSLHATFNYAYCLAFSGRAEEGERIILERLRASPRDHFVLTRAAKFYLIIKDYGKAAELYARDYEIFPSRQTRQLINELRALREEKNPR
jgi:tetratricopeptide (TPR) repeat protein